MTKPTHEGFTVTADEERVQINTPTGSVSTISDEAFSSVPHPGPIVCSWDPSGNWVAVFIPYKQATEIRVYDLRRAKLIQRKKVPFSSYPKWYQNAHAAYDEPIHWKGSFLGIVTRVTLRPTGVVREMPQSLSINSDFFIVTQCLFRNTLQTNPQNIL